MAFAFRFNEYFPDLVQADFDEAYSIITTMYSSTAELWANDVNRDSKRLLYINYLVAWYLADKFPDEVVGIIGDGGKPIKSKNIGGVSINYQEIAVQNGLEPLTTNTFGLDALRMLLGAPERFKLYGRSV